MFKASKSYTIVVPIFRNLTCAQYAGMHAWFAVFVDTRYSVVVPIIGVQVGGGNF